MAGSTGTTMSVRDMGRLLGLKKTESYYLVHKNEFETVVVSGKIRIVRASFEAWYMRQDRYRKTDGEAPGSSLHDNMYSVRDIMAILNLSKDSTLELIHRLNLLRFTIEGKFWVPKVIFDEWYASQSHYRNADDRKRDRQAEEDSITVPEMGRLIGLNPREAWKLYNHHKDSLEMFRIADKPRITKSSFHRWLDNQSDYRLITRVKKQSQATVREYVPVPEAANITGTDTRCIHRMLKDRVVAGRKVGRVWYVRLQELLETLCPEQEE